MIRSNRGPRQPNHLNQRGKFPAEVGIRQELVARVRAEIAAGTYETPEKLAIAVDRLAVAISR